MSQSFTLRELELLAAGNQPTQIVLKLLFGSTYQEFVQAVEAAIDNIADRLSENPQLRQDRDEDEISIEIVDMLRSMTFAAEHDMTVGGHGDIVVRGRGGYLWIGEAKKHRDYEWLLKGFKQLATRYATGLQNQSQGSLIVYSYGTRIDEIMNTWREYLTANVDLIATEDTPRIACFRSRHISEKTGVECGVRHLAISLRFAPQDRS